MPSSSEETASPSSSPSFGARQAVLCALILWGLSVVLQWHNGAFTADIGADPDEPAHAVTSLMLRDYYAVGLWRGEHPLHFAQRYYDHFPKVALGHYPPGFYLLAGAWLLPWPTKTALMLFMGLLSGVLGATTAVMGHRCGLDKGAAFVAGVWVVLLPITQKLSMLVMSDLLLATLCLLAAGVFAKFIEKPRAGTALLFGALAAAAILTKASAVSLALVPPLSILFLRRWTLLLNWRLWLAPVPVALTALPWTLMTMKITQEGMQPKSVSEYFPEALRFYADAAVNNFGVIILVLAFITLASSVKKLWLRKNEINICGVALVSFGVALFTLYLVSPTGLSSRYLLPLVPLMLIAAASTLGRVRRVWTLQLAPLTGFGFVTIMALVALGPVPPKVASGFGIIADDLTARSAGAKVLVSSDARGEGSLIAELAFRTRDRSVSTWSVVRSSKFLASSDWIGRDYKTAFANRDDFLAALQRDGITWIVEDRSIPADYHFQHHRQLEEWCAAMSIDKEATAARQGEAKPGTIALLRVPDPDASKP